MTSKLAGLLLVAAVCIGFAAAQMDPLFDCCPERTDKPPGRGFNPKSYTIIEAGEGCKEGATVFETRSDKVKNICVPHPSKRGWVAKAIQRIDKKKEAQQ